MDSNGGSNQAGAGVPPRPAPVPVDVEGIPAELRAKPRWVCWVWKWTGKKWDKPPVSGKDGRPKKDWNAPSNLVPFAVALETYRRMGLGGVGYVHDEGEVGIDLDSCVGPDGAIAPEALEILRGLGTYAELSPSGTGVKGILRASLSLENGKDKTSYPAPWQKRHPEKAAKVEVFGPGAGYFTMTGRRLPDMTAVVEARQEEAEALHARLASARKPGGGAGESARQNGKTGGAANGKAGGGMRLRPTGDTTTPPDQLTDEQLWARLFACKNGDAIRSLYDGNITGYESASEATLALLNHLRWVTRADAARMERMFLQSKLKRDKWEDKRGDTTWGAQQIAKALEGDIWEPRPEAPAVFDAGGGVTLAFGHVHATASGTVKAKVEARKGGKTEDVLTLSDSPTGRGNFVKTLAGLLNRLGADGGRAEELTTALILGAAARLKDKGTGGGVTLHALVTDQVPQELGLAFRCPKTVWSEVRRAEIGRNDLVTYTPDRLLQAAASCRDAPQTRDALLRALCDELGVLWADLMQTLPDETGAALGPDSQRGRAFRRAFVQLWKHTLVFEVERGRDNAGMEHAARSTLAERARRVIDKAQSGGAVPGEWVPVMAAFDAFVCVPEADGTPLLGMRATLPGQVKHALPGVPDGDGESLLALGVRYGVIEDKPAAPAWLENGQRFFVLSHNVAGEILARPAGRDGAAGEAGEG